MMSAEILVLLAMIFAASFAGAYLGSYTGVRTCKQKKPKVLVVRLPEGSNIVPFEK